MKFIKRLLTTTFVIFILITLTFWGITKAVNLTAVKDLINSQLTVLTAQKSQIKGDITWHLFPRPAIKITQLQVGDEKSKANYSLQIENLVCQLQLAPLFHGNVIFNELKIDGMKITVNPDAPISEKQNLAVNKKNETAMPIRFAIERFLLTHGQITIQKLQNKITISDLHIGISQLNLKNKFFPIQLKAKIALAIANNKIKTPLTYKGRVRIPSLVFTKPLTTLQNAVLDGQLSMQNLRFNRIKITKVNSGIKIKQGEIVLNPFNLSLYAGKSSGDLNYHFLSQKLTLNQTATNIDAQPFLKDLFANSLLNGNLDFTLHASTNLQDNNGQNLQGNGNVTIRNGTLYFVDLNKLADETINKIHSLVRQEKDALDLALQKFQSNPPPPLQQEGNTKFQLLTLDYRLQDNKLINDTLVLQADRVELKGQGQVNLSNATQNFNLLATLNCNDKAVNSIQRTLGGGFPIKVSGKLDDPQILPNIQTIGPVVSNYLLKSTIEKPVKQIKKIKDLLASPVNVLQENLLPEIR